MAWCTMSKDSYLNRKSTEDYNMPFEQIVEIVGAVIGLAYLFCEYKANIALWYVGILMSVFYVYIFLNSHLYANAGIYAFNFGANIYGLFVWYKKRKEKQTEQKEDPITHCPTGEAIILGIIAFLMSIGLEILLSRTGNSASPAMDGLTAALGIVAMWMMAHKYLEQWFIWIGINLGSAIMCFDTKLYPSAIMFSIYFIVSILGFYNWRKMMKNEQNSLKTK